MEQQNIQLTIGNNLQGNYYIRIRRLPSLKDILWAHSLDKGPYDLTNIGNSLKDPLNDPLSAKLPIDNLRFAIVKQPYLNEEVDYIYFYQKNMQQLQQLNVKTLLLWNIIKQNGQKFYEFKAYSSTESSFSSYLKATAKK